MHRAAGYELCLRKEEKYDMTNDAAQSTHHQVGDSEYKHFIRGSAVACRLLRTRWDAAGRRRTHGGEESGGMQKFTCVEICVVAMCGWVESWRAFLGENVRLGRVGAGIRHSVRVRTRSYRTRGWPFALLFKWST